MLRVKEFKERHVVHSRALLRVKLEPIPVDAARCRTWRNSLVQTAKFDTTGQALVTEWLFRAFRGVKDLPEDSGFPVRLDVWAASEMTAHRAIKQVLELEQDIVCYAERCGRNTIIQPKGQCPRGDLRLRRSAAPSAANRRRRSVQSLAEAQHGSGYVAR